MEKEGRKVIQTEKMGGKFNNFMAAAMLGFSMWGFPGCSTAGDDPFNGEIPGMSGDNSGNVGGGSAGSGDTPSFDSTITPWSGDKATDAAQDKVGTDEDFYHEANTFTNKVTVKFADSDATIESNNNKILCYKTGAYVTIDMQTNSVSKTEIVLSGSSSDGALKIYGDKKFKLTLNGVSLTSKRGPAINSQDKKRMFVHLQDGTSNYLTDNTSYTDDAYYLDKTASEDRKGCFFSEGSMLFSGTGVLAVAGKYKHGVVTDGYLWTRPGVTIAVTEAAANAIHVKGDSDDKIGVCINGGLIYANVASTAGKGIKTDYNVEVKGGTLNLNTTGGAEYDKDEKDTSSASCIKTDGDVIISGGTLVLKSSGKGGKGINCDGALTVSGGSTTVTTTGAKFTYSSSLTSSPKGVKADGDINITGGALNIAASGSNDGAEALESKALLTLAVAKFTAMPTMMLSMLQKRSMSVAVKYMPMQSTTTVLTAMAPSPSPVVWSWLMAHLLLKAGLTATVAIGLRLTEASSLVLWHRAIFALKLKHSKLLDL